MLRKLKLAIALAAWAVCAGAHLDLAQVYAWSKMFASNLNAMSYAEAALMTFEAEAACELCHWVAGARQDHREQTSLLAEFKEKSPLVIEATEAPVPPASERGQDWGSRVQNKWLGWVAQAPVPPPRALV